MEKFQSGDHIANYIIKILKNKGVIVTKDKYLPLKNLGIVYDYINNINYDNKFDINFDNWIEFAKKCELEKLIEISNKCNKSIKNFIEDSNEHSIQTLLDNTHTDTKYNHYYLMKKPNSKDIYYPKKIKVIQVYKTKMRSTYNLYIKPKIYDENKFGIYFIYDNKQELVYIGKSNSNVVRRSLESMSERIENRDFYKIDYILPKTRSDNNLYELYYISKYKPKFNSDSKEKDELTFELPKLEISYTFDNYKTEEEIITYQTSIKTIEVTKESFLKNINKYKLATKENIEEEENKIDLHSEIEGKNCSIDEYLNELRKKYLVVFKYDKTVTDNREDKINYINNLISQTSNKTNKDIDKTFNQFYDALENKYGIDLKGRDKNNKLNDNKCFINYCNDEEIEIIMNVAEKSYKKL